MQLQLTAYEVWSVLVIVWNIQRVMSEQDTRLRLLTKGHVTSVPPYMVVRCNLEQVRFQCYVDGVPARKGQTEWMRDGHVVECNPTNRVFACYNIIIITQVRAEDVGDYTCRLIGNNSLDMIYTSRIIVPASFQNPKTEFHSVSSGGRTDLESPVSNHSYPPPLYIYWRKGNNYLAQGPTLHIQNMSERMAGVYESVSFNGYGEPAVKTFHLSFSNTSGELQGENDFRGFIVDKPGVSSPTNFILDDVEFESVTHSGSKQFLTKFYYVAMAIALFASLE